MKHLTESLYKDILAIDYGNLTKKQIKSIKEKSILLYSELLWFILQNGDLYEYTSIPFVYMDFYVKNWKYTKLIIDKFIENEIIYTQLNDRGTKSYSAGNGDGAKAFCAKYKLNLKYYSFEDKSIFNLDPSSKEIKLFKGNYKHIEYNTSKVVNQSISNHSITYHITGKNSTKNDTQSLTNTDVLSEKKYDEFLTKIINKMKKITINTSIYKFLENYEIDDKKIYLNQEALDMSIKNTIQFDEGFYSLDWLFKKAQEKNMDLIVYKDKAYIENEADFIKRKSHNGQIHMLYTVETINNKNFYAKRNETNRRLDSTITNMKSDLRDYLLIDGEEAVELDIANAQFAILAYLYPNKLDKDFIQLAQSGELYQFIGDKLYNFTCPKKRRNKAKMLMIQTAFSKSEQWQTPLRKLFPKTMILIDKMKENDHKEFSKLLQNTESKIIIDNLLPKLLKKYEVYTIHDAFLVKKSVVVEIKEFINNYFNSIGLKCKITEK
jgi:hypothetical protein